MSETTEKHIAKALREIAYAAVIVLWISHVVQFDVWWFLVLAVLLFW